MARAKKEKKFEDYEKTQPEQLILFANFGLDTPYSRTIELYDFIPKYYWGKLERTKVEQANKEILSNLERFFECRGVRYKVTITPASIKDADGIFRDYFPSKREELVEDALRKIACEKINSVFLDGQAGVKFTLYQLRKELRKRGHGYSIVEIKEALLILSRTHLELFEEEHSILESNIFQTLALQTQDDWKSEGKKTMGFVRFNPLVTKAIRHMKFRELEYETSMAFKSYIARQLFKRLSHHYIQAGINNRYGINLLTIIRDFGLKLYDQLRDNLREVIQALEELKKQNVVASYEVKKTIDAQHHKKLIDVTFTILTTPQFNAQMKEANARATVPSRLIPTEEVFP